MTLKFVARSQNIILEEAELPKEEKIDSKTLVFLFDKETIDETVKLFRIVSVGEAVVDCKIDDLVVVEIYSVLPKIYDKQYFSTQESFVLATLKEESDIADDDLPF